MKSTSNYKKQLSSLLISIFFILLGISCLLLTSCSNNQDDSLTVLETKNADNASIYFKDNLTPAALDSVLSSPTVVSSFTLDSATSSPLSEEIASPIMREIQILNNAGYATGFLMLNLENGKGIAYNLDENFFSASSIKAPYCVYVAEKYLETEINTLDDVIALWTQEGNAQYIVRQDSIKNIMEATITESSNGGQGSLVTTFNGTSLQSWLDSLNIDYSNWIEGGWFQHYSTRDLSKMWIQINNYISEETLSEPAQLIKEWLGKTNMSFIKNALSKDEDIQILNKAGWNVDPGVWEGNYNAICDAGLITQGNNTYLITIMSDAPYNEENAALIENIIASMYIAQEVLA